MRESINDCEMREGGRGQMLTTARGLSMAGSNAADFFTRQLVVALQHNNTVSGCQ